MSDSPVQTPIVWQCPPAASTDTFSHAGTPMQNGLLLAAQPTEGDTITIGADVYEFRDSSPPAGGTAGRIWVYSDAALYRNYFMNAVNGAVDTDNITRTAQNASAGTNVELVFARNSGITVLITSAATIGGDIVASNLALDCYAGLTIPVAWNKDVMYGGYAAADITKFAHTTIQITTDMITTGKLIVLFGFIVNTVVIVNRSRPQNELYLQDNDSPYLGWVQLTLAGGASPNNQAGDIVDFFVTGS